MPSTDYPKQRLSSLRNWLGATGLVTAAGAVFAFIFLLAMDAVGGGVHAYLGVLTWLVAPAFFILGLLLMGMGHLWHRRNLSRGQKAYALSIDLSKPEHQRNVALFAFAGIVFMLATAFGSYKTYHYTESVEFCGEVCHVVMKPEYTTYQRSAHARVSCADCHIGGGAEWFVKAKISGAYQVYATLANNFPRPVPTPIRNLRPAQDTCEKCHWPEKFTGNLDRSYQRFLADRQNTPYTVRMLLRVGGGQPGHGPFGGIHWHMSVANKVEYYATDPQRLDIPWIRVTPADGPSRVYRVPEFEGEPPANQIRTMDCMDCHNRPAHVFRNANDAVDEAMAWGRIGLDLPLLKRHAVDALTAEYETTEAALIGIEELMARRYPDHPSMPAAVAELRRIYELNFFPEMKADWRAYPDHLGHKDWPGCFRCHNDRHATFEGATVKASDCNSCHTILAQGSGADLLMLSPGGIEFKHPGGDLDGDFSCSECHTGGLMD
jgi:hypothetical protein